VEVAAVVAERVGVAKAGLGEMGATRADVVFPVEVEAYGSEVCGGGVDGDCGVCEGGGCGVCDCVVEELSATAPHCSASPPLRTGRSSVGRPC
jgi:hypothetical protein